MNRFINKLTVLGTALSMLSTPLFAADVKLQSADGAFALSGQLVDFDGEAYILKSVFGEVRIEANAVECSGDACPDLSAYDNKFTVTSNDAIGAMLLPVLLEDFSEKSGYEPQLHDGMRVELLTEAEEIAAQITLASGEINNGFGVLADGSSMIAIGSIPPERSEVAAISDAGFGDITSPGQQSILAMDALVILVSQDNPVGSLTTQQAGEIFSGKISNWNALGGPDAAINVYRQNIDSVGSDFFANRVLAPINSEFMQATSIISNNGDLSESVNDDPFGIGYIDYANRGNAKAVTLIGGCGVYSAPSDFSIKTEEYPLSRRVSVYVPKRILPSVASKLVTYLRADTTQQSVARSGYVSLEVSEKSVEDQGLRMASAILSASDGVGLNNLQLMMKNLVNAKRLSTTFRFLEGSSTLDVRAQSDVQRLLDWMADKDLANKEILLVGFTDSNGKLTVNMALAEQRAKQVLNALETAAPEGALDELKFETIGLGEVSPMVCNDALNGRFVNRRVEVWVRDKS